MNYKIFYQRTKYVVMLYILINDVNLKVRCGKTTGEKINTNIGVPQGDFLSPVLIRPIPGCGTNKNTAQNRTKDTILIDRAEIDHAMKYIHLDYILRDDRSRIKLFILYTSLFQLIIGNLIRNPTNKHGDSDSEKLLMSSILILNFMRNQRSR